MRLSHRPLTVLFAFLLSVLSFSLSSCETKDTVSDPLRTLDNYVYFINVGRGDAILIKSGGSFVLIDTGRKTHTDTLCRALESAGVQTLDALIITHNNSDHMGGINAVTENFTVKKMFYPLYSEKNKDGKNKLSARAEKLSLPHSSLVGGDSVTLGGVTYDVLGPLEYSDTDENDNSLVLRAEIGGIVYLFTGDMQFAEEQSIMSSSADINCDVLKVPNHGNPDATGEDFAAAASPLVSVICTSTKEDGNSAARRVLDTLAKYGEYHLTEDSETGILIYHDGNKIKVLHP